VTAEPPIVDSAFETSRRGKRSAIAALVGSQRAAAQVVRQGSIDVVFEVAQFFGHRFPAPVLAWIPDFQHRHLPEMFSRSAWLKRELGFRLQLSSRRSVILSSEDAARDCLKYYRVREEKLEVVRFSTMPSQVNFKVAKGTLDRLSLPENFLYMPNQFWRHKNHAIVMDALAILKRRGANIMVACSGNPKGSEGEKYFRELSSRMATLGLEKNFRFLGMVTDLEVRHLMAMCTAVVNPSLFEGWSSTVEEAKAIGAPLILSHLSVHREQAGDKARFFDPHSAEQVAEALQQAWAVPCHEGSRRNRFSEAFTGAERRAKDFANRFELAVRHAVERDGRYTN
jgi:glycosyltransferase involved in cell wall biosynthesis